MGAGQPTFRQDGDTHTAGHKPKNGIRTSSNKQTMFLDLIIERAGGYAEFLCGLRASETVSGQGVSDPITFRRNDTTLEALSFGTVRATCGISTRKSNAPRPSVVPSAARIARINVFRNSRMFPGQGCSISRLKAAVSDVIDLIKMISGEGIAVLLVEQNIHAALAAVDDVAIMVGGEVVEASTAQTLGNDPKLQRRHLGLEPGQMD